MAHERVLTNIYGGERWNKSLLRNQGCNPIMIDPHFFEMRKAGYTSDSFKNTAMCLIGGMIHMIGIQKSISEETPPERVGAN